MKRVSVELNLNFIPDSQSFIKKLDAKFKYIESSSHHGFVNILIGKTMSGKELMIFDQMLIRKFFYFDFVTIFYLRKTGINLPHFTLKRKNLLDRFTIKFYDPTRVGPVRPITKNIDLSTVSESNSLLTNIDSEFLQKFTQIKNLYLEGNGADFLLLKTDSEIRTKEFSKFISHFESMVGHLGSVK